MKLNMYKVLKSRIEHEKVPVQKFNILEITILVYCKGDNLPQQTSLNMIWQKHIRIYVFVKVQSTLDIVSDLFEKGRNLFSKLIGFFVQNIESGKLKLL